MRLWPRQDSNLRRTVEEKADRGRRKTKKSKMREKVKALEDTEEDLVVRVRAIVLLLKKFGYP